MGQPDRDQPKQAESYIDNKLGGANGDKQGPAGFNGIQQYPI